MATVFSNDVVEIAVRATLNGKMHVNVWHMFGEEDVNTSDEDTVRDFANNWQDHIVPETAGGYTVNEFAYRSMDPDDSNVGTLTPDVTKPVSGTATNIVAPPNVAYLIHKRTTGRPRGARDGRMFMSGVPENAAGVNGEVAGANVNAWNAALALFLAGVSNAQVGVDRYPVVLQTTPLSRAPGTTPITILSRRITSLVLDPVVATQRDRLR